MNDGEWKLRVPVDRYGTHQGKYKLRSLSVSDSAGNQAELTATDLPSDSETEFTVTATGHEEL